MENLASIIEDNFQNDLANWKALLEKELIHIKNSTFDYIVLGCTHYSLVKKTLEETLKTPCVCPAEAVAKHVKNLRIDNFVDSCASSDFQFLSTKTGNWKVKARTFLSSWHK